MRPGACAMSLRRESLSDALMTSVMSLRHQPAPPPNHPISSGYRIGWLGGGAGWNRKPVTDVTGASDKDSAAPDKNSATSTAVK
jgi:hypothetical protein